MADPQDHLEELASDRVTAANACLMAGASERYVDGLLWEAADLLTLARLWPAVPG